MPYIDPSRRMSLADFRTGIINSADIQTAGELNYIISMLCKNFLGNDMCYDAINEVIGVLECAKQELYRKVAVPYEEHKEKENGSVY